MSCPICNSPMSEPVEELFALPSVTSDCRPWSSGRSVRICSGCGVMQRVTDNSLFKRVYDNYRSYPEPQGRTRKILEFVKDKMLEPNKILDIGCGEGYGIEVMKEFYPEADIHGYEPYRDKKRPENKYDLVTLFHVLEHVEDINEMLDYVKSVLTNDGHLLIQVPYTSMWPFDLVLADHWWHFNPCSLSNLLIKKGFNILYLGNDVIKKELTILAEIGDAKVSYSSIDPKDDPINWILNYKKFLDTIDESIAVFGTAPAAAWAGSILGDKVVIYLEDDLERRDYLENSGFNKKQVAPAFNCKKLLIVAPFPDWQLPTIKAKHPELRFL